MSLRQPKENEILIKSFAAGVNSFDGTLLSGKYAKVFGTQLPSIPGYDVAGTVEKVGANVKNLKGEILFMRSFQFRMAVATRSILWRKKTRRR